MTFSQAAKRVQVMHADSGGGFPTAILKKTILINFEGSVLRGYVK